MNITLKLERIEKYWGTTYGNGRPSVAAIIGPGGPSTATKVAVDGPRGPLMARDRLRCDSPHHLIGTLHHMVPLFQK